MQAIKVITIPKRNTRFVIKTIMSMTQHVVLNYPKASGERLNFQNNTPSVSIQNSANVASNSIDCLLIQNRQNIMMLSRPTIKIATAVRLIMFCPILFQQKWVIVRIKRGIAMTSCTILGAYSFIIKQEIVLIIQIGCIQQIVQIVKNQITQMNSVQQNTADKFKKKFNTDIEISSCFSKSLKVIQSNPQKDQKEIQQLKLRKPIKKSILKKIKQMGKGLKYLTQCQNSSQQSEISVIQVRTTKCFRKKKIRDNLSSMQSQKKPQAYEQSLKRDSSIDSKWLQKEVVKQGLQELKLSSKNSQNNDLLKQIQQDYDSHQDNFLSYMF